MIKIKTPKKHTFRDIKDRIEYHIAVIAGLFVVIISLAADLGKKIVLIFLDCIKKYTGLSIHPLVLDTIILVFVFYFFYAELKEWSKAKDIQDDVDAAKRKNTRR